MSDVQATLKDRQAIYGPPDVNFRRIAAIANIVLADKLHARLDAVDIALLQICIKMGRLAHTPTHIDSVHDVAGYALCLLQILEPQP